MIKSANTTGSFPIQIRPEARPAESASLSAAKARISRPFGSLQRFARGAGACKHMKFFRPDANERIRQAFGAYDLVGRPMVERLNQQFPAPENPDQYAAELPDRRAGQMTLFRVGALTTMASRELCVVRNLSTDRMRLRAFSLLSPGSGCQSNSSTARPSTAPWSRPTSRRRRSSSTSRSMSPPPCRACPDGPAAANAANRHRLQRDGAPRRAASARYGRSTSRKAGSAWPG